MTNEYIVERDGFAFVVPENHNFKFELLAGQQILDVAFWSKENPKNKFLSMHYTLFRNGLFITKGSKLWSDYKIREVIMECVDETKYKSTKDGWFHHFLKPIHHFTGASFLCVTMLLFGSPSFYRNIILLEQFCPPNLSPSFYDSTFKNFSSVHHFTGSLLLH